MIIARRADTGNLHVFTDSRCGELVFNDNQQPTVYALINNKFYYATNKMMVEASMDSDECYEEPIGKGIKVYGFIPNFVLKNGIPELDKIAIGYTPRCHSLMMVNGKLVRIDKIPDNIMVLTCSDGNKTIAYITDGTDKVTICEVINNMINKVLPDDPNIKVFRENYVRVTGIMPGYMHYIVPWGTSHAIVHVKCDQIATDFVLYPSYVTMRIGDEDYIGPYAGEPLKMHPEILLDAEI